jgi:hypothetical protein
MSNNIHRYQLFYDDAWELFADMDTNADGVLTEKEFLSNLDLINVQLVHTLVSIFAHNCFYICQAQSDRRPHEMDVSAAMLRSMSMVQASV